MSAARRRRREASRGSSIAEALVAAALAGVALAAIVLVARLAGSGLQQARDTSAALALAEAQLEMLRAAPRDDGSDEIIADGVQFSRAWSVTGGRGRAARVAVEVAWREHRVSLATGVLR